MLATPAQHGKRWTAASSPAYPSLATAARCSVRPKLVPVPASPAWQPHGRPAGRFARRFSWLLAVVVERATGPEISTSSER